MVETFVLWVLVLASYMSLIPICTCQDGVFRVPLTLKHDYNVTTIHHSLQATSEVSKHHDDAPKKKKKKKVAVEITPFFTGPIVLGGQQFEVVFDTGSEDLWVFGNKVNKEYFGEDGHVHHYYNNGEESATGEPFKESYGNDHLSTRVTGVKVLDTLNIGGIEVDPCRFGVVNKIEASEFITTRYDGIMGLSYQAKSIFTSMVRQRLLRLPMFSVYMAKDSVRGEIMFGSWDDRYFKYPFEVNRVHFDDDGMWVVSVRRLGLGNSFTEVQGGGAVVLALVDTGCSNLSVPPEDLHGARQDSKTLDDALDRDSGTYGYVPCSSRSSLPTLKIKLGSRVYVLNGEDYTNTVGSERDSDGQEWCPLEMDDLAPHRKVMIIGVPFFRKYYTMFFHEYDGYEGPVVAFAEAKHPSS